MDTILYFDAALLKHSFISGATHLINKHAYLDKINVFPVPDGDTGTNMASTMRFIRNRLRQIEHTQPLSEVAHHIAEAALYGARGNSGAILAQFFQGFSETLSGKNRLSLTHFSEAISEGANKSYLALSEPKEGTILTVILDFSKALEHYKTKTNNLFEGISKSLEKAYASLQTTKHTLKEMKRANVVDAGAQGFIYWLEGVLHYMKHQQPEVENEDQHQLAIDETYAHEIDPSTISYTYCSEFLIEGAALHHENIRASLHHLGDSVVIAGSTTKLKVHIHTNQPEDVFKHLSSHGEIIHEKIDNMRLQAKDAQTGRTRKIAILTDSACDLPNDLVEKAGIHQVPVRVHFGKEHYIDRLTLHPDSFYKKLVSHPHHPKTSQPSPLDFERMYTLIGTHFQSAIALHVPKKYSGTYQASKRAAEKLKDTHVDVIDTRSVSVGIGLLALEASDMVENGHSHQEIVNRIHQLIKHSTVAVQLSDVGYLIKGGRLPKSKGALLNLLNLKPVLTLNDTGDLVKQSVAFSIKNARKKMRNFILKQAERLKNHHVGIVHANDVHSALLLKEEIETLIHPTRIIVSDLSPALGVHGGPGTIAIAITGDPK